MPTFEDLDVWDAAHGLTIKIYKLTKSFPAEERFGLKSQIRRSAASVPTNIAEGSGRFSKKEYRHFVGVAMGSASETQYLLRLTADLGLISPSTRDELRAELLDVKRMLHGLAQHLDAA